MYGLNLTIVYFFYGLAFFTMGVIVLLERDRGSDQRLRHALGPLAVFGLVHGANEWLEMFMNIGTLPTLGSWGLILNGVRLGTLAFSFISLTAFGASLLSPNETVRRYSLLLPVLQTAIWGFGVLILKDHYTAPQRIWDVADVWSRYTLGVPSAVIAAIGLVAQQRAFRKAGMAQFGRDSLYAALAFAWYGLVGQIFVHPSALPPSTHINQDLFFFYFGFPVQIFRAITAAIAAAFVVRFLRAFEVERQRQLNELQEARVEEARRREILRGQLLRRVVMAQEAERQRVARELHDETGQALTAIGLGLRGVTNSMSSNPEQAAQKMRQIELMASRSLDELRHLIADLRPSHLDELGLRATLRWYFGEVQARTKLQVHLEVLGDEVNLLPEVRIALYRIIQESITNTIKHAQASEINVKLAYLPAAVQATIEDNGQGFDMRKLQQPGIYSWGLLGMQERTSLLGGQFNLVSWPGEGTRISVTLPYQPQALVENLLGDEDHEHQNSVG